MRIWAAYRISYKTTVKFITLAVQILLCLRGTNKTSYPWCRSQRSSSRPAELLATEQQLSSEHQGTTPPTLSPLERSTSDLVWRKTEGSKEEIFYHVVCFKDVHGQTYSTLHEAWDDMQHVNKCACPNVPVLKLNYGTLVVESDYFHNVSNAISVKKSKDQSHLCSSPIQLMSVKYSGLKLWTSLNFNCLSSWYYIALPELRWNSFHLDRVQ